MGFDRQDPALLAHSAPCFDGGPLTLADRTQIAPRVFAFEFARPDGQALPPPEPGAHALLSFGDFERRYSLLPPVTPGRWRIAVLREAEGRGGSVALCDRMAIGARITFAPPENYFALASEQPHALLIAGGIGITPILAMAEALHDRGTPFTLHYCIRSAPEAALLEDLRAAPWADALHLHDGAAGTRLDLGRALAQAPEGSHLYACGPERLNSAALSEGAMAGWPPERLHVEHFGAAAVDTSKDAAFWIELSTTGERFEVPPGRSIVEVLADEGIFVTTSCAEGHCGMCITNLLSGMAEHRDAVLTEAERASGSAIAPCCSRGQPGETLVLEL